MYRALRHEAVRSLGARGEAGGGKRPYDAIQRRARTRHCRTEGRLSHGVSPPIGETRRAARWTAAGLPGQVPSRCRTTSRGLLEACRKSESPPHRRQADGVASFVLSEEVSAGACERQLVLIS
jgi:hypothetical protein